MNEVFERFSGSGNVLCTRANGRLHLGQVPLRVFLGDTPPPPQGGSSQSAGPRLRAPFPGSVTGSVTGSAHCLLLPGLERPPSTGKPRWDKLAGGVSFQASPLPPPSLLTDLEVWQSFGFFLPAVVCVCVCVRMKKSRLHPGRKRRGEGLGSSPEVTQTHHSNSSRCNFIFISLRNKDFLQATRGLCHPHPPPPTLHL